MGKFGWAYLGCGNIAHTTARELVKTEDQQIVAVWNRTQAKAEKFAEKYGAVAYKTAEEAITAPGVEGVYIAVTADKHAEYMRLCIKHRPLNKPMLVHIQMGIDFHGCPDAGVTDGLGEGSQTEVGIVLVLDVIVRHISMSQAIYRDRVGQTDGFAGFPVSLAGTAAVATVKREIGGTADILVLPVDGIVL